MTNSQPLINTKFNPTTDFHAKIEYFTVLCVVEKFLLVSNLWFSDLMVLWINAFSSNDRTTPSSGVGVALSHLVDMRCGIRSMYKASFTFWNRSPYILTLPARSPFRCIVHILFSIQICTRVS